MNRAALAATLAAAIAGLAASSAQAAVPSTCSYNPSNHNLVINDHSGPASLRIYRLANGELRYDDGTNVFGLACPLPSGGTANVTNTDRIAVFSNPSDVGSGGDSYVIDEVNGPLGPGFTPESDGSSEIEVSFDTLGARPNVQFNGTGEADRIEAMRGGSINFALDSAPYSDQDQDVTFTTQPALMTLHGGKGNDFVSADGMDITRVPGPANYPVSLFGDDGHDLLAGGDYGDFLAGGPGDDRYVTSDDHGAGDWLTENAGEGSDGATVDTSDKVNGEIESRFVQFPVGKLKLSRAGISARAGGVARVKFGWWHPKAWRDLRSLTLRVGRVGSVKLDPASGKITARGAVALARGSKLGHRGKAVTADLALRVDRSLAGSTLRLEVDAVDRTGRRQDEALAGALTVR